MFRKATTFLVVVSFSLGMLACGGPEEPSYEPPKLSDPRIDRQSCEPAADAPRLRNVAVAWPRSVRVGPCGELVWRARKDGGMVYYAASDASPVAMPDAVDNITDFGFAPIHIDGQRILLASHRRVYLAEEGEIVQEWETGDVGTASAILPPTLGPIPETDAFWACSETGGLQRLDAEGVTDLAPDFSASHSPCRSLDVSWDAIAYRTQDDRIGVVQLSTGARHTFDHPFFPLRAEDEDGQRKRDVIRVSPDGSFVLHAERPVNEAGHVILSQQSEIAVLPVGGLPTRIPGKLDEPRQLDSLILRMENPWMSRGLVSSFPVMVMHTCSALASPSTSRTRAPSPCGGSTSS